MAESKIKTVLYHRMGLKENGEPNLGIYKKGVCIPRCHYKGRYYKAIKTTKLRKIFGDCKIDSRISAYFNSKN